MRFLDTFRETIHFSDKNRKIFGNFSAFKEMEVFMRNAIQKGRCIRRSIPHCSTICKSYDKVQDAYAVILGNSQNITEIKCNVLLTDTSEGEFTTDFVITKGDGTVAVRECVIRSNLLRPRTIKLLDLSQRYWLQHGVTDWKVVTNDAKE